VLRTSKARYFPKNSCVFNIFTSIKMAKKAQPFPPVPTPSDPAKAIITSTRHHVEVLASPGSGKTHTLIARLSHLLSVGVPPAQILVLSFSNAAVRELRRRMDLACTTPDAHTNRKAQPSPLKNVRVQTAHAFALSLLSQPAGIISDKLQRKLLKQSIKMIRRRMRHRTIWTTVSTSQRQKRREQLEALADHAGISRLLSLFDYQRAAGLSLRTVLESVPAYADLAGLSVVKAIQRHYTARKHDTRLSDFADVLDAAEQRIQQGGKRHRIKHLLIDEFQDCSTAQTRLLAMLASRLRANIMVFGDPTQSVYGFAGSSYRSLADFLPDVYQYRLPVSRRLTHQTAAFASAVAQLNPTTAIQTHRQGPMPVLVKSSSHTAQIHKVVADIQQLLADNVSPADIAVLARNKATLHAIEAALLAKDIDSDRISLTRTHAHARAVLRIVRLMQRHRRTETAIPPQDLLNIVRRVRDAGNTVEEDANVDVDAAAAKQARELIRALPSTSLDGLYQTCGRAYLRMLGGMRANPDIAAQVNRWEPMCRSHSTASAMLAALREHRVDGIATITTIKTIKTITTSTIHTAKGREWPYVLVVGVTEGILPDYRANDDAALAQERNLLYVAITRAKTAVRLYHAPSPHALTRKTFDKLNAHLASKTARKHYRLDESEVPSKTVNSKIKSKTVAAGR
jgi:DNA helicase II / ATP-dependent DNA helicase PcrA